MWLNRYLLGSGHASVLVAWQCKNCAYRGPLILESGNMAKKLQEEWAKKKSNIVS